MAFCEGAMSEIRKLWHNVTEELTVIITDVLKITGEIKALETNPTVTAIVGIIPNGSKYVTFLNAAIDIIVPTLQGAGTAAEKIGKWLDGKSKDEQDSNLLKLAAVTVKLADTEPNEEKTQKFYDSAVQLHTIAA